MRLVSRFCFIVLVLSGSASFAEDYAKECAEKIMEIPDVNCLDPRGEILPITVNGVPVTDDGTGVDYQNVTKCDRPHLLSGQCYPFSRIFRFKQGNSDAVVLCRRTDYYPKNSETFGDVAIIEHNKATGATCFFQSHPNRAKTLSPYLKSRTADQNRDNYYDQRWSGGGFGCTSCHSAGPFLRSPFIWQVHGDDKGVPWETYPGKLHFVGSGDYPSGMENIRIDEEAYDKKFPLTPEEKEREKKGRLAPSDACTKCHASGGSNYVNRFVEPWVGNQVDSYYSAFTNLTDSMKKFPYSHWMPPHLPMIRDEADRHHKRPIKDHAEYSQYYSRALEAIRRCGDDPNMTVEMEVDGHKKVVKVCKEENGGTAYPETPAMSPTPSPLVPEPTHTEGPFTPPTHAPRHPQSRDSPHCSGGLPSYKECNHSECN